MGAPTAIKLLDIPNFQALEMVCPTQDLMLQFNNLFRAINGLVLFFNKIALTTIVSSPNNNDTITLPNIVVSADYWLIIDQIAMINGLTIALPLITNPAYETARVLVTTNVNVVSLSVVTQDTSVINGLITSIDVDAPMQYHWLKETNTWYLV